MIQNYLFEIENHTTSNVIDVDDNGTCLDTELNGSQSGYQTMTSNDILMTSHNFFF